MKSLSKKIIVSVLAILMLVMCFSNFKALAYDSAMSTLIKDNYSDSTGTDTRVNKITATVITVVRIIGVAVAIMMLLVIAMKYMMAAPGDKADIKKSAIVYVIGAVVLFGATALLGIIADFSKGIN